MAAEIPKPLDYMKPTEAESASSDFCSHTTQIRRRRRLIVSLVTALGLTTTALFLSLFRAHAGGKAADGLAESLSPVVSSGEPNTKIPPLPEGVTELKFSEFFVHPVGPRGLELSEKVRGLEGHRVRILGYMAQRVQQPPGSFVFTPFSMQVYEDFPASAVQVSVPTLRGQTVPYAAGLMLLTGTLTTGNHAEPDGRISLVRLALDPPEKF
jgi:hypothetical protein